jgi:hypothetical protein
MHSKHLIFIVNGNGVRKMDYYEDASLSPNTRTIAEEGFVFTEDHCDSVASHCDSLAELLHDLPDYRYLNLSFSHMVPTLMQELKPRILVLHETGHDVGHDSYEEYVKAVKATDERVGQIFNWVRRHPYFNSNTAIVLRPEFGRDDEINHGELHHSEGFYCAHRVASIFWGPDFNQGTDQKTVINRLDMVPTLSNLLSIDTTDGRGRVVPGLFKK